MDHFWKLLIIACILLPLVYALYYFGIIGTRVTASWFHSEISLPTRWEGSSAGTSGYMRRRFAKFRKYQQLSIETETSLGAIECEVNGSDGSALPPVSASYGQDVSSLVDVSQYKHCTVTLRMKQFHGRFRITLQ